MPDWTVTPNYIGADGKPYESSAETVAKIHEVLGDDDIPADEKPVVVERGAPLPDAVDILTEDGKVIAVPATADETIPFGYHRLRLRGGKDVSLIVSPGECWYPDDLR